MIRRPPRSTLDRSSAASDVYKRQAEYDANKPLTLAGTLAKIEWVNPHGWIHVDVKQPDGTVKKWTIETANPNQLVNHGLKKADFVDGMSLTVKAFQGIKD